MAVTMGEAEIAEFIGTDGSAVLTTLRSDGRAVPLPVWYVAFDGALYVRTPVKSRRVQNLRRDPRVAVLIHDGEQWAQLRGVLIQADVEVVDDDTETERVRAAFDESFADRRPDPALMPKAMSGRYSEDVILRMRIPAQPVSWDNRKVRFAK